MPMDLPADLNTPRLHLRPLRSSDERLYGSLYTDPDVMRHVALPLTPAAAQRAFSTVLAQLAAAPPRARYWVLCRRDDGDDIGLMAWLPDCDDAGSAEVGAVLAGAATCRGHATEAIAALAGAVFSRPAQRRLWARHGRENGPAVGLMHKLGFAPLAEAGSAPGLLCWQLERQAWIDRRAAAFASVPANC